jgi:hypothetical protein
VTELRAGEKLSRVPGVTTIYAVTPGGDHLADVCLGTALTTELAALIVAAVNHSTGWMPEMHRAADRSLAEISWAASRVAAEAAAAERARIVEMLTRVSPLDFLARHGLHPGGSARPILLAAVAEIEGTP